MALMLRNSFLPDIIDEFFGRNLISDFDFMGGVSIPAINVVEGKDDFSIEVAVPGLNKKDFKIDVHNNVLTISSEKEHKNEEKNGKYMRKEFSYAAFKRCFSLPDTVAADKVKASHKDGILNIVIPKKEEAKKKEPKQIAIS